MKGFSVLRVIVAVIVLSSVSVHAHAQCASPVGAAGDMTYNDNEYVMQWCDGTNWYGSSRSPYIPNAVNFDGTNDYLLRGSDLIGISDSKMITGSFWFRNNVNAAQIIAINTDGGYTININPSGHLDFTVEDSTNTIIASLRLATSITDGRWHHIIFSFDLSNVSNRHVYLDGVSTGTYYIYTDAIIDFTKADHAIGAATNSSQKFLGDLSDLWVDFGTYLDLSNADIRRQFIDDNGFPVDLGTDGSKATGAVPDIFLSGDTATWHTNKGTGGGFTENGALTDALADPGENLGPTGGLVGWWKLDEVSGTTAADAGPASLNGTMIGGLNATNDNVDGMISKGINFDGIDDYIDLGTSNRLTPANLTVSAWIRRTQDWPTFYWAVNAKGNNWTTNGWYLEVQNGGINLIVDGANYEASTGGGPDEFPLGTWVHVAGTFDTTTNDIRLYRNGVEYTTNIVGSPSSITNNAQQKYIGRIYGSYEEIPADMDDVRIYSRALTPAEITELYDTGYPCKNPVGQRDGDTMYNLTHHVPQFCDLREWVSMTPAPGDGGAGCSNPTAEEGDMMYNASENFMQYCEGDTWQAMGVN